MYLFKIFLVLLVKIVNSYDEVPVFNCFCNKTTYNVTDCWHNEHLYHDTQIEWIQEEDCNCVCHNGSWVECD